ncbi:glutamyl-tRNA reductase [Rhizosphaericola mali]|uniref:Glutamyl-tRNA reductase n=1 Tax=Rhizosphaericola mali TaxID=2545455 RepID=A0A5P2G191_9BACT|nr:glutamyl-tRNA reductase [Rhizosphaericola mali]QES89576.1 glutamyl-tRNA reductase [Rhizosphaericola mali]
MDVQNFYLAGINYKKTDVSVRGKFALTEEQQGNLLQKALGIGLKDVFVIATCNRTEIYGVAPSAEILTELLCHETEGEKETFEQMAYIYSAERAMQHLFEVAAGLDSQILGDYEVVGQMKQAVQFAKEQGTIAAFSDRLANFAVQASKEIKNKTSLSGGTLSTSFAAIQFLKWHLKDIENKKIVLIGAGKIGTSTARNLVDYLHTQNVVIINRSLHKAQELAEELNFKYAAFEDYENEIADASVIITATNNTTPIIQKAHLQGYSPKIIVDLCIPNNVNTNVKEIPGTILVNVDELSQIGQLTFSNRKEEIPAAQAIIRQYLDEFADWYKMRRNVPFLKVAKQMLESIQKQNQESLRVNQCAMPQDIAMQKAINNMAVKLKEEIENKGGCNCIEAINYYITATSVN